MNGKILNYSTIKDCNSFSDRIGLIKFMMLQMIDERETGLGAWEVQIMLKKSDVELSTATAGRYLKELDNQGYTVKIGNKGRILTEAGKKYLIQQEMNITSGILHKNMQDAVGGKEYRDLRDIYAVRIGIESEAVKLCCKYATDEEIEKIGEYAKEYSDLADKNQDFTDISLDFHILIAKATRNDFMESLLTMLVFEQKKIENSLEYLATRSAGKSFSEQHREIYESLRDRDASRAARLMRAHFEYILNTMEVG